VSAVLLGITLLGESPEPRHFAGMALIGLGLAVMDGRPLALVRGRSRTTPTAPMRPRERGRGA
jgi:drug/metabolite transporter (DMT)-like permease